MVRERSVYYRDAHEHFLKIGEGLDVERRSGFVNIERNFERWLAVYAGGRFVRLQDKKTTNRYLFLRMVNRFQAVYKVRLKEKLSFLHFVKFRTFLTLTVDPKRFLRLSDEYLFISKAWSKLRQALGAHRSRFFYLRILEITKRGRPHLHVLTGLPFIDIRTVRKLWVKYGGGVQCKVRKVHSINGLSYLLKYVTKSISSLRQAVDSAGNMYASLLFASNRRLFSYNDVRSRSMLDIHHKSKCDFLYTGTVTESMLSGYCVEFGLELNDRLEVFVNERQDYDWKELFGVED